jgi:adenylate cyclase
MDETPGLPGDSVEPQGTQRRLAAILASDMVGYSRLIEADEEGTLARQKAHRKELIDPAIAAYHGRIVKSTGDGLLVEFPSVVDAFRCAVSIQLAMPEREAQVPEAQQITYRVGINLGDIVIDDDDIYGDGVNIAARLEGLAEPGGICVSRTVVDQVKGKINSEFEDLGAQQVKNIAEPIQVYRVRLQPEAAATEYAEPPGKRTPWRWAAIAAALAVIIVVAGVFYRNSQAPKFERSSVEDLADPLPGKPSVAVLPFTNMSDDPEQEYFSDGISEDIITDLSKLKGLTVIARNSSFTYKGKTVKIQEIGKDLGVQFILEGSVRKAGDRIRITTQLIDAESGHHLWAERFDRKLIDIFAVQDEITHQIVSALSIQLSSDEQNRLAAATTSNFEAYDLFLRGQQSFTRNTEEALARAVELYRQAIRLDPGYAHAYAALAIVRTRQVHLGYSDSPARTQDRSLELARKALSIDPTSPQVQWALGYVYMYRKQFDEAVEASERAVSLSPNYADGYGLLALIKNNLGQAEEAIRLLEKAIALNPYYTWDFVYQLGRAYYAMGEYDKAVSYLRQALERNDAMTYPRLFLAASYVELGQTEDAEWEITQLQMSRPHFTLSHLYKTMPIGDEKLLDRLFNDLRSAGLPE